MNYVKIFANADEIATAAKDYVLAVASSSIERGGVFNLVLAGGSTPRKLYELLAKEGVDWSKWQFFMGDERFVPLDDERSNQNLAQTALLDKIPVGPSQIHAVPVDQPSVEQAAEQYEKDILDYFGPAPLESLPDFDLILLGMGSDAHTASLFPGKPAINEAHRLAVASTPGVLPPPVNRVTFTLPLINAARHVLFMVAGPDKAEALKAVQEDLGKMPAEALTPAGKVRPAAGELLWFVDRAAADG